jgi:FKBP12-rapamycin complex-associated protein
MLHRFTGKILHIDFGDCFEVAMRRERFPETVPFRLTRMLVNAMEVSGVEGTCEILHLGPTRYSRMAKSYPLMSRLRQRLRYPSFLPGCITTGKFFGESCTRSPGCSALPLSNYVRQRAVTFSRALLFITAQSLRPTKKLSGGWRQR